MKAFILALSFCHQNIIVLLSLCLILSATYLGMANFCFSLTNYTTTGFHSFFSFNTFLQVIHKVLLKGNNISVKCINTEVPRR